MLFQLLRFSGLSHLDMEEPLYLMYGDRAEDTVLALFFVYKEL